jgi:dynein heavy chain 1
MDTATSTNSVASTQKVCADILSKYMTSSDGVVASSGGILMQCLDFALQHQHIMEFTPIRALKTLFAFMRNAVAMLLEYNAMHQDFPLALEKVEEFLVKKLMVALVWR